MIPLLGALLGNPSTMITLGSAAIRAAGKIFGGKTEKAADQVAGFVDNVQHLPEAAAKTALVNQISSMPAEDLLEFKKCEVELAGIHADVTKKQLETQAQMHKQFQARVVAEINSHDQLVRQNRPQMARESFLLGSAYMLLVMMSKFLVACGLITAAMKFEPQFAAGCYAIALTYFNLRSADGIWGKEGKGSGASVAAMKAMLPGG